MRLPLALRHTASLLLPLLLFLAAGCTEGVSSRFYTMETDGWEQEDTLSFPLDSVTAPGRYALTLTLRLSAARPYPYTDICLLYERLLPSDTASRELSLPLTEGRNDMSGSGVSLYAYDVPLDTLQLREGESGLFRLAHTMRLSPLTGVRDVGLTWRRLP